MASVNYQTRRDEIETYFDRTAADAWAALTSDAPVSRIRRTVRRGRGGRRGFACGGGVLPAAALSSGAPGDVGTGGRPDGYGFWFCGLSFGAGVLFFG